MTHRKQARIFVEGVIEGDARDHGSLPLLTEAKVEDAIQGVAAILDALLGDDQ
jgi:hypothetical protein